MNKFRILEKMKTESSPQLTKPKTQKNKRTNSPEQRTNYELPNNSVGPSGLKTIKKCLKILQWNCKGIRANEELLLLLDKYNLKVACLQETFLKDKNQLNINFPSYNHLYPWCNCYRRRKWTRRHEFKSSTRLIAFHLALISLGIILPPAMGK